ncbi:hypothetical protein ISN45_Aa05g002420, partial [Arabidopsis thaliana x Arabidopsis arenosa]
TSSNSESMEKYMKAKSKWKRSEKFQEVVATLLKHILFVLKTKEVLAQ